MVELVSNMELFSIKDDVPEADLNAEERKEKDKTIQKLKRFFYTFSEEATFISGNALTHNLLQKVLFIQKTLDSRFKKALLNVIEEVEKGDVPQRSSIILVLAVYLGAKNLSDSFRNEIYITVGNIIKDEKDIFLLLNLTGKVVEQKKVPSGMQKVITKFYNSKSPLDLAKMFAKSKGDYGWSHKDLIKLIHWKHSNSARDVVMQFALFGPKKCAEMEVVKNNDEAKHILDLLTLSKTTLSSKDENVIAHNIPLLKLEFHQLPGQCNKSPAVWKSLIPTMPLQDLVNFLPWMYKAGLLAKDSPTQKSVLARLKDDTVIKQSKIQPLQVLIAMRNFEKGGKPKDIHLIDYLKGVEIRKKKADDKYIIKEVIASEPIKGSPIPSALYKAMTMSLENIALTKKSIFITIDARSQLQETPCLTTKNVSCLDAATILTLSFLKASKKVTVATFKNDSINLLSMDKNNTFTGLSRKIQEGGTDCKYTVLSSPMAYAINKKIPVDIFVNMGYRIDTTDTPTELRRTGLLGEAFKEYNKKLSRHARFINCFFGMHNSCAAHGFGLDINGFDSHVGEVINAFIRNNFH